MFKRFFLGSVLFFFLFIGVTKSSTSAVFDTATSYYLRGNYDTAITIFRSFLKEDEISGEIFYNLGNCFFKKGEYGYAVLYYEKAKKVLFHNKDINHNLSICNAILNISQDNKSFRTWFQTVIDKLSFSLWFYMSFICLTLVSIFISLYLFAHSIFKQKLFFFSGILFLLIFFLFFFFHRYSYESNVLTEPAIILLNETQVKSAPSLMSNNTFVINSGLKVRILDKVNDWYKIEIKPGEVGWVEREVFEFI